MEVLDPVAVADGARVGDVPGLVRLRAAACGFGGGEGDLFGVDGDVFGVDGDVVVREGVVEDAGGDAVEDGDGARGWGRDCVVGFDG